MYPSTDEIFKFLLQKIPDEDSVGFGFQVHGSESLWLVEMTEREQFPPVGNDKRKNKPHK
ncbi:hypothetical protein C5B42_01815 [Candidatus Cerribacteria bacterium 'Amazon FNV 2010 28 9']|uniref:Uncharacterized protein n=1 Tax=Candidatus Cerribacteria bacterium 'Amazon FNV 2010 28 9' TaxID=2081795 RepID=A0A317JUH2_9BACT|nr:MAG: hypothetical protein C5B42_01815 [Candidatus Cerribacteria bacterium 'Amazon FNV 2010 28 9']